MNSVVRLFPAIAAVLAAVSGNAKTAPAAGPRSAPPTERVQFNRDVRPILADKCWSCHGPDGNKRKAGLRLDEPGRRPGEAAVGRRGDRAGPARRERAVAADRAQRSRRTDAAGRAIKQLGPGEKQILRRWIEQGAEWQPHWAYVAPVRPPVPAVRQRAWAARTRSTVSSSPRLERAGLAPSPEADPSTLIRRLSFDLDRPAADAGGGGAFVERHAPDAYETAVDRLLASPALRRADGRPLARPGALRRHGRLPQRQPAQTSACTATTSSTRSTRTSRSTGSPSSSSPATCCPDATTEQRVASGYNRLLQTTEEGGRPAEGVPRQVRRRPRAQRVDASGSAATMGCAECHDHKFDPITTKDFYRFAAFFADVEGGGRRHARAADTCRARTTTGSSRPSTEADALVAPGKRSVEPPTPELAAGAGRVGEAARRPARPRAWTTLEPRTCAASRRGDASDQEQRRLREGERQGRPDGGHVRRSRPRRSDRRSPASGSRR